MNQTLSLLPYWNEEFLLDFEYLKEPFLIFSGMILALLVLFGVCVVVCLIKRNRGGKYAVQEQEQVHGRNDYDDAGGFMEYTHQ